MGLEAGANDYVAKPFKFAVLLARIRAQLRQHEASEDAAFRIGPYTFRPGAKLLVSEKGSKLKLTEKETAILRFLYRAGQKVVVARHPAPGGLGLQRGRHHAHARDARLPAAPEDRDEPLRRPDPRDRARRLQAPALRRARLASDDTVEILRRAPVLRFFELDAMRVIANVGRHPAAARRRDPVPAGRRSDGGYVVAAGPDRRGARDGETDVVLEPGSLIGRTALFVRMTRVPRTRPRWSPRRFCGSPQR